VFSNRHMLHPGHEYRDGIDPFDLRTGHDVSPGLSESGSVIPQEAAARGVEKS
jgi:hypothetical protein